MTKLSGIIIAKNEENQIVDCLESLDFCDEVIVVDNGSTDRTAELAIHAGAKVVLYKTSSYAKARNAGLENAKYAWILYIDADERVSKKLKENILNSISKAKIIESAFKIKRKNFYYGNYEWPQIEKLERLFKKDKLKEWYGQLHESPKIDGQVGELEGFLLHYSRASLEKMLGKTIEWSKIEAELRLKANHPRMTWWRFPRVMVGAFFDSYIRQGGWRLGTSGLIESMYQSFSMFITYARLWEMQIIKDQKQDE